MYDLYILKPSVAKTQYSKHLIFREKKQIICKFVF